MVKTMPDKIASAASYGVSGTLVFGGGMAQWLNELNWDHIAIISGIVIGIATFLVNLYYYKRRQNQAYEAALASGYTTAPPQDR